MFVKTDAIVFYYSGTAFTIFFFASVFTTLKSSDNYQKVYFSKILIRDIVNNTDFSGLVGLFLPPKV